MFSFLRTTKPRCAWKTKALPSPEADLHTLSASSCSGARKPGWSTQAAACCANRFSNGWRSPTRSSRPTEAQRARFVNRQRGSGTRLIVDRLLAEQGLAPERIRGYGTEEYTHLAVAATIAAGRADAGIGVRAAAAQLDLGFVPMLRERYWLVLRERTLATAAGRRLVAALKEKAFTRLARKFVGYAFEHAGEVATVDEVRA